MKKLSIHISLLILSLYVLPGCTKNSAASIKVVKVENARFATSAIPNVKPSYTALACTTTDSMPGTKCVDAKGSSCSAPGMCVAVKGQIQSGLYTREEVDRNIDLVEKAFGIRYTY
jgi:hypothetical protein